jgi:hypothetical protein
MDVQSGSLWLAVFLKKEFLFVSSQNGDHQFGDFLLFVSLTSGDLKTS